MYSRYTLPILLPAGCYKITGLVSISLNIYSDVGIYYHVKLLLIIYIFWTKNINLTILSFDFHLNV